MEKVITRENKRKPFKRTSVYGGDFHPLLIIERIHISHHKEYFSPVKLSSGKFSGLTQSLLTDFKKFFPEPLMPFILMDHFVPHLDNLDGIQFER